MLEAICVAYEVLTLWRTLSPGQIVVQPVGNLDTHFDAGND